MQEVSAKSDNPTHGHLRKLAESPFISMGRGTAAPTVVAEENGAGYFEEDHPEEDLT